MGVDHPGLAMSLGDLVRMVRREAVAALQNSSIGRAGLRFYNGGKALFQGGGGIQIDDDGYILLNGNMTGVGVFDWSGNAIFRHTVNIVGPSALGATLTVTNAGKIIVGNIIIDPTISGGAVAFANGAQVFTDATTIQVFKGNSVVQVSDTQAKMQVGGTSVRVQDGKVFVNGISGRSGTGLPVGTLGVDPDGEMWRAT